MKNNIFIYDDMAKQLGTTGSKQANFQSYSGVDISAFIYMPTITKSYMNSKNPSKSKLFAELQTISISSTRSISPVRVFGRSSPVAYTRGARTIAGTMVFASINQDAFSDLYDQDVGESTLGASSSLLSDQLPPFSIVLTAANEKGGAAIQVLHGVTLVNYGTTYSIDDLYTEVTYSYVATDLLPLMTSKVSVVRDWIDDLLMTNIFSTVGSLIEKSMKKAYGTAEDIVKKAREINTKQVNSNLARFGFRQ